MGHHAYTGDVQVYIDSLLEGARNSRGTTVVIDVFRAFSTAAVAFSRGAHKILLTAEPDEALALRAQGAGQLCMGEVGGERPPGFDFGNSPHELSLADVAGKTLIQSTRAGTVGVCAVPAGRPIFAASLMTASATARAILQTTPVEVTLVPMGKNAARRTDEDEVCALYLRNLLQGRTPEADAAVRMILVSEEAVKYGDPRYPYLHPRDLTLATSVDAFDFAVRVEQEGGLPVARRVDV